MKRMINYLFLILSALSTSTATSMSINDVEVSQRYPWNGKVDIMVTVIGESNEVAEAMFSFAATNSAIGVKLATTHITANGIVTGSGTTWTSHFVWDAATDIGNAKIDDVTLAVDAKIFGVVQLWENGPYWAECNVGASTPEGYGYYFWWGDTVGYKRNANNDGWMSVADGSSFSFSSSSCPTYGKDNSSLLSAGYIDSTGNLVAKYDAATAHLGSPWRMPTADEIGGLVNNCTTTWTTLNGVYGRLVTGKGDYASKSIFLPAVGLGNGSGLYYSGSDGDYWSSTLDSRYLDGAWGLDFGSSYFSRYEYGDRYRGRSVRPVRGFAQ